MNVFTVETEIDLGDIGIHYLDISAQVEDTDPESMPKLKIKRAVVTIEINGCETKVDITERISPSVSWTKEVLEKYLSAKERVKYREPDDDPYSAA